MNIKILCSLQKKYFCKKKIGTIYSYNLKRTMKIQKKKYIKFNLVVKRFQWPVTKINSIFWTNSARAKSWFNYFQPLVFWELPLTTFYHSTHRMFEIPGNNRANYNWIPNEKSGPKGWLKLLQSNYESSVRESRMLIRNRRAQDHWQCITVSPPLFPTFPSSTSHRRTLVRQIMEVNNSSARPTYTATCCHNRLMNIVLWHETAAKFASTQDRPPLLSSPD